jgi:hypothetical protein
MLYQQVASGRAEEIAAGLSRLAEGLHENGRGIP